MEWLFALTAALKQRQVPKDIRASIRTFFLWETRELCCYNKLHVWTFCYDQAAACVKACAYCHHVRRTLQHNKGYSFVTWFPHLSRKRIKL